MSATAAETAGTYSDAREIFGAPPAVLQPVGDPKGAPAEVFSSYNNLLGVSSLDERESVRAESDTTYAVASTSSLNEPGSAVTYPIARSYPASDYRVVDRGQTLELQMEQQDLGIVDQAKFDFRRNRFPYSVVFQPLPPLTWLCPLIGHMGICDSRGRVHDFQGPYTIRVVRPRIFVVRYI
eukprot:8017204-Pyramimonas_sp.AAC.2